MRYEYNASREEKKAIDALERRKSSSWASDVCHILYKYDRIEDRKYPGYSREDALRDLADRGIDLKTARWVARTSELNVYLSGLWRRPVRPQRRPVPEGAVELWLHVADDGRETFYSDWTPEVCLLRVYRFRDESGALVEETLTRDRIRFVTDAEGRGFEAIIAARPPGEGWVVAGDRGSAWTIWRRPAREGVGAAR